MSARSERRPWLSARPATITGVASSPRPAGPARAVLGHRLSLCAPRHRAVLEPLQLPCLALTQGHTALVARHRPSMCHPRHEGCPCGVAPGPPHCWGLPHCHSCPATQSTVWPWGCQHQHPRPRQREGRRLYRRLQEEREGRPWPWLAHPGPGRLWALGPPQHAGSWLRLRTSRMLSPGCANQEPPSSNRSTPWGGRGRETKSFI